MVRIHQSASLIATVLSESREPFFILCAENGTQNSGYYRRCELRSAWNVPAGILRRGQLRRLEIAKAAFDTSSQLCPKQFQPRWMQQQPKAGRGFSCRHRATCFNMVHGLPTMAAASQVLALLKLHSHQGTADTGMAVLIHAKDEQVNALLFCTIIAN